MLGVGTTSASGLGLAFSLLCDWAVAAGGTGPGLPETLLEGVSWSVVVSALFSGVDRGPLLCSPSDSFLAWAVSGHRRPALAEADVFSAGA